MVDLEKYTRLEALGHYWPDSHAAAQEVVIQLGRGRLLIRALDDQPVAQWSLAALETAETEDGLVLSPGADGSEVLLTQDRDIIAALKRPVLDTPMDRLERGLRLRRILQMLVLAAIAAAVIWVPKHMVANAVLGPDDWNLVAAQQIDNIARQQGICELDTATQAIMARFTQAYALDHAPLIISPSISRLNIQQDFQGMSGVLANGRFVITAPEFARWADPAELALLIQQSALAIDPAKLMLKTASWGNLMRMVLQHTPPTNANLTAVKTMGRADTLNGDSIPDQDWARLQAFCSVQLDG